jgi:protein-S-isoprenylcysteine O-methyltransferase Ste14
MTPTVMVKLFGFTLTGARAVAALLVLIAAIVALVVWIGPTWSWSPLWISAALWLAFTIYWSAGAKRSAPSASRESPRSRQFHQTLMNLSLVLLFARIPGLTQRLWPGRMVFVVAGLLLHLLCVLLAVWARRHLGRFWSGEIAAKQGHELIRSGPYRKLRHPIYTAMVGMCLATALVSGELHAAAGVALMAAAYVRKIRLEERNLEQLFGAVYADYRKQTWALVPWLI